MTRTLLLFDSSRWREAWIEVARRGLDALLPAATASGVLRFGVAPEWLREDLIDHRDFLAFAPARRRTLAALATADPFLSAAPAGLWDAAALAAPWESLELRAPVIHLKTLAAGARLSYGGTYVLPRTARVATVAVGYGDGYRRALSNRSWMLVGGIPARVAGRVCMDQTLLDLADHPDAGAVRLGAPVLAAGGTRRPELGPQGCDFGTLASRLDVPVFELLAGLGPRVERMIQGESALEPLRRLRYG